tara:strand:- start:23 stop:376 length:354 start_codon:yes stop_codon:yes gene_type:complete
MIVITFPFPLNTSVQVGDFLFAQRTTNIGQYTRSSIGSSNLVGVITKIENRQSNKSKITIENEIFQPSFLDFICFAKSNAVNASSLKGYYAETTFVNNSRKKAELFGVTAEIQQSSK